jgi:glucokinase
MILAGDIGGTKTVLALIAPEKGGDDPVREERFASSEFESLESIVREFLKNTKETIEAASFGLAGPVVGRQCHITNLPWVIDADNIAREFGFPQVNLLNDLRAIANAVPHLKPDEVCVVNQGHRDPTGVIGVIAPGTGLGEAFLTWTGKRYQAWPSEGGHASFAPITHQQLDLLEFLEPRYGHVSFERICSGKGFPNIYDYLISTGRYEEPDWLRQEIANTKDPTPIIMDSGLERKAPICIAAVDLFVRVLGGVIGNMALKVFATGGIYLGGGLPPRMIPRLQKRDFHDSICYKGRFRDWVAQVPVNVILDPKVALHGAAWHGLEMLEDSE